MSTKDAIQQSVAEYDKGLEYARQGMSEKAADYFSRAVRLNPGLIPAYLLLAMCRTFQSGEPLIQQYFCLTHSAHVAAQDRAMIHFALAKIQHDLGQPHLALTQARLGNDNLEQTFDWEAHRAKINRLIRVFSRAFLRSNTQHGVRGVTPVFLLGLPQSGVERVAQTLRRHPHAAAVVGGGVAAVIDTLNAATPDAHYPENTPLLDYESLLQLGQAYLTHVRTLAGSGVDVIIDCALENSFHLGLIALLFPQAKILICQRDPLDCCLAQYMQYGGQERAFAQTLTTVGVYAQEYRNIMRHWLSSLPVTVQVMQIQYEEWVTQPTMVEQVLRFCQLDAPDPRTQQTPPLTIYEQPGWAQAYAPFCAHLQEILNTDDYRAKAYTVLGEQAYAQGACARSRRLLSRALKLDAGLVQVRYRLFQQKRFRSEDDEVDAVKRRLRQGCDRSESVVLHFALAKAYADMGRYDQAFAQCEKARQMHSARFDLQFWTHQVDTAITCFDPAFFQRYQNIGVESPAPVFFFGVARSEIVLIQRLLAAHPLAFVLDQAPTIAHLAQQIPHILQTDKSYPSCLDNLSVDVLRQLAVDYFATLQAMTSGQANALILTEGDTVLHLGFLAALLPRAKFIHCRRNAVDACLSRYFYPDAQACCVDLFTLGRYYQQYERLLAHWRQVSFSPIFEFDIDQWLQQPEAESRKLFDYCDLDWESSYAQGIDRCSVLHSAHYQCHLSQLRQGLGVETINSGKVQA